jgi:hypothetical protein
MSWSLITTTKLDFVHDIFRITALDDLVSEMSVPSGSSNIILEHRNPFCPSYYLKFSQFWFCTLLFITK